MKSNKTKHWGRLSDYLFLIAALTMLTTMTRMTSNQRTQIGVLKALAFPEGRSVSLCLIRALARFIGERHRFADRTAVYTADLIYHAEEHLHPSAMGGCLALILWGGIDDCFMLWRFQLSGLPSALEKSPGGTR